jgi:hypothetical protein
MERSTFLRNELFLYADLVVLQTISGPSDIFAFAMSSYEVRPMVSID